MCLLGRLQLTRVYLEHRATWPGLLATARSPQCVWHARDAEPARLWPLYATITLGLDRMSAGILRAVGMLASRSSLIDDGELGPDTAHTATAVRSVLATESRLDYALARPSMWPSPHRHPWPIDQRGPGPKAISRRLWKI